MDHITSTVSNSNLEPQDKYMYTEIIEFTCRLAWSWGYSFMQMAVEKPNPPVFSYKFQEIFNSGIFTELTNHTESKMIILRVDPCKAY